jgi:hypothetical protein
MEVSCRCHFGGHNSLARTSLPQAAVALARKRQERAACAAGGEMNPRCPIATAKALAAVSRQHAAGLFRVFSWARILQWDVPGGNSPPNPKTQLWNFVEHSPCDRSSKRGAFLSIRRRSHGSRVCGHVGVDLCRPPGRRPHLRRLSQHVVHEHGRLPRQLAPGPPGRAASRALRRFPVPSGSTKPPTSSGLNRATSCVRCQLWVPVTGSMAQNKGPRWINPSRPTPVVSPLDSPLG